MSIGFYKDLTGKKFTRLTVLGFSHKGKNGKSMWNVRCECGKTKVVLGHSLISGDAKSCGCSHRDWMKIAHGTGCKDLTGTVWCRILFNAKRRKHLVTITKEEAADLFYSQKKLCALSGVALVLDAPVKQVTASLDRIDSTKGYELGNVQWVHKDVNWMKNTFSQSDFLAWVKKIAAFHA